MLGEVGVRERTAGEVGVRGRTAGEVGVRESAWRGGCEECRRGR